MRALVFGYACHNTTLNGTLWSGDYAGFAQEALEKEHPGALALFCVLARLTLPPLARVLAVGILSVAIWPVSMVRTSPSTFSARR